MPGLRQIGHDPLHHTRRGRDNRTLDRRATPNEPALDRASNQVSCVGG
ncbi:hypothetical protein AKJ09_10092 [Labilithrix luteola]|uniref:Uncharacterized protein n=1 Tax=Labilithrix luteola TaxID=1391654 RepID=A0A0K1QCF6_9BACT|nr:hypothetical protein AKJ09_10092 [Labilithrix luteola]